MSSIGQVRIGSANYQVVQASAINQKKLLTIVGARIAFNSAAGKIEKIDDKLVFGYLLSAGEEIVDQIAEIVLHQCGKVGEKDKLVTVDDFQNDIHSYFMLIAGAVRVNLNDFFIYLDKENAATRAKG
jgi:hypothetical protein